jgi:MSHA pilin protein MshC
MPIANAVNTKPRAQGRQVWRARGFTLVELIMVLVLTGVLAVFAAPRIFNSTDFYARGFHDETMAMLRYAQKTAIAQRRTVCVTFAVAGVSTATLRIASAAAVSTCDTNLVGPRGDTPGKITSKTGVNYSASPPSAVSFDGLGQPLSSAGAVLTSPSTITVAGSGKTITIEPATGYVHE